MMRYWEQNKRLRKALAELEPLLSAPGVPDDVRQLAKAAFAQIEEASEIVTEARSQALSKPPVSSAVVPPAPVVPPLQASPLADEEGDWEEEDEQPEAESAAMPEPTPLPVTAPQPEDEPEAEEAPVIDEADLEELLPGPTVEAAAPAPSGPIMPWLPAELTPADLKGLRYLTVEEIGEEETTLLVQAWPAVSEEGELSWAHCEGDGKVWLTASGEFAEFVKEKASETPEPGVAYAAWISSDHDHRDFVSAFDTFTALRSIDSLLD